MGTSTIMFDRLVPPGGEFKPRTRVRIRLVAADDGEGVGFNATDRRTILGLADQLLVASELFVIDLTAQDYIDAPENTVYEVQRFYPKSPAPPVETFSVPIEPAPTTTTSALTLPVTTIPVDSTESFTASGVVYLAGEIVEYAGKTSTTLMGCTGGAGPVASGEAVRQAHWIPDYLVNPPVGLPNLHVDDAIGAHAASAVAVTPAGGIVATTAQAALVELDSELAAETAARSAADAVLAAAQTVRIANPQATGYTTVLADAGKAVEYDSAPAGAATIPPNASVAYPTGTIIEFVQVGAGALTLTPGAGVTITGDTVTPGQGGSLLLRKTGTNAWWGAIVSVRSGTLVEAATLTADGDLLTRSSGVPSRVTRAALATDAAFVNAFRQKVAAASVYRNADQVIPNSVYENVLWTTKLFDEAYMHNDVAFTARLVAPSGYNGLWSVEAQITFAASAGGTLRLARIRKNDSIVYAVDGEHFVGTRPGRVTISALVDMAAGDYITVEAYHDTGGNLSILAGADQTRLSACWLGKPAQSLIGAPMLTNADTVTDSVFWTRPFANPASVGTDDKYVWIGSTDHGNGFNYRGLSAKQTVIPSSWVKFLPPEGTGRETPHLVYEPTAAKPWRLYYSGAVVNDGQKTFLASYPTIGDMVTASPNVTAHGIIFPNNAVPGQAFDHTGYAYVERRAANDYHAWSLVQTGSDPKFAHWTSTDGIAWVVADYPLDNKTMVPAGRELVISNLNRVSVGGTTYAVLIDQPDTAPGGTIPQVGRRVVLCEMPTDATFTNVTQLWTPVENGLVDNLRNVRAVVDETNPNLIHLYIHNDKTVVYYKALLL